MAESQNTQGFEEKKHYHPSAPLTQTGFQPFTPFSISFSHAIIRPSAQPNLENLIFKGFQMPAVEINSNPYQGLKLLKNFWVIGCPYEVEINSNPYQGLKHNKASGTVSP